MRLVVLTLLFAALLSAADTPKADVPPTIPPEVQAKFWRALAHFNEIAPVFREKEAALRAARAEAEKFCGEKFVPDDEGKGMICSPKKEATPPVPAPSGAKK